MTSPEHGGVRSPARARAVLAVLVLVYAVNFIDRNILSVLLQPIKAEIEVSDTAMGLLTGFAFAVFYTFAGIPIARLADRGSRARSCRSASPSGACSRRPPASRAISASSRSRAPAWESAIMLFVVNLIGLGLGPTLVGALSDAFEPRAGALSLRYALLCALGLTLCGTLHSWLAGRSLARDLARSAAPG